MNRLCYKTVFSKRLGALVAVGEHASSQSKSSGEGAAAGGMGWRGVRFVGLLAIGFAAVSLGWSQTLPQGAQVTQGGVSVNQAGNQMAITQTTAKAVVNWQSFDIGQNAKVNVLQPNSQSVLLNRVLSDNPTQILGQLQANGQVVLVNPKGIVVGSDGSVSASAFTASTLNISDADFMAGVSRYVRGEATGSVINKGVITSAPGGYVALLGPTVQNEGRIVSPQGAVVLGAGDVAVLPQALTESLYMPVGRTGKIKLELTPATVNAWVKNEKSGVIVTEGGHVYMQAAAVHSAMASVLQSGSINTSAAQAGEVHLLADGGRIVVDGQIKANSSDASAKGGSIVIGRDVNSGALAASTDVSAATLESQKGFVETSGQHLVVDGIQVKAGEWLLDPTDITIGAATSGIASSGTNPITQNPNTSGTTASTISATTLASALSGGTSVVVQTTNASGTGNGDITVANNIAVTGTADATLTLKAERDIVVNAGVSIARTGSNKLNVVFNSDLDGNGAGAIVMKSNSAITSNGGNITLGGGSAGDASNYARGYSARPNGLELSSASINAGGGNIRLLGQGGTSSAASGRGVVMTNSTVSTTGGVSVIGIGGVSTNTPASFALGHNNGVLLDGGSVTGGSSSSTWIWGQGGAGASAYNYGVSITNSATVTSTGGTVILQGTGGGTGSSDRNIGVQISQSAQVTSNGGNVNVEGTGGNTTGGLNAGVAVVDGGKITVSGSKYMTVTATGGGNSSTSGGDNMGLWMAGTGTGAPLIESASGNIFITGAAGGATTSAGRHGISVTGDSKINSTAAQVTLTTDSLNLVDSSLVSANTTSGTVTVRNRTAGTLINVGGTAADAWASVPNTLAVSQAELGKISAATTVIGRNDATGSGLLTVSGAVNMGAMGNTSGNLTLTSGSDILLAESQSITKTAGSDATLTFKANGDVNLWNNSSVSSTSNKLNVVVNSDADASGAGAIRMILSSISSNGGNITMGGGANASTYAIGDSALANGILFNASSLSSAGGNISLKGKSSAANNSDGEASAGIRFRDSAGNIDINSGSGTISMDGVSQSANTGGHASGVMIGGFGTQTIIQSSSSATNAIDIVGTGTTANTNASGIWINSTASILSTGTGGVSLTGTDRSSNGSGETAGVFFKNGNVLSSSGKVSVTGTSNAAFGIEMNWAAGQGGTIGYKAGTSVTGSSADIVLTADSMRLGDSLMTAINTTGSVTLQNKTAGKAINIGSADVLGASGSLGLTQAELNTITASNLKIGSTTAGDVQVSSAITTKTTTGNVAVFTGGNIAINSVLNVGDDPATAGTVEASKNLTLNATGPSSTVTDGASGAIKATGLELLGATAAYTLDSTANSVSTLAGNTGSVTLVDSTALQVATVNSISSANTVTGTVGLTTTGNISLAGSTTAASKDGLLVSQLVNSTGSGSITLSGTAAGVSSGQGVYLGANVTANTGAINVTGLSSATSPVGTGVYVGSAVSSKGAISLTGTGKNIGVNIDTPGSVISLANGSNFAGTDAISITGTGNGTSSFAGVLLRKVVNNNSSNGATTIKSLAGIVRVQAGTSITNASSAGAINIAAGDGTAASTAGIVYNYTSGTVPQITQNANADVVLTTDGQGDLSSPKIVKNGTGAGDIVLAAGKVLAAGVATGGQVKPVAGNSVTNSGTGNLYVYSGSPTSANTAAMSSLDASLANLYLSAVGANVQNADANVAFGSTIASGPKAQVMFRSKVNVGTLNGATVSKTYGDANTGNTDAAALWTDMLAALNTANSTSGVSNVNSTSTTAGTLKITDTAIIDSLSASTLQSTAYSTAQKLKANTSGYTYSAPVSSKYTTALTSGQSAIVTVALKALTPSVTANDKVYNDSTAATLATQTVSGVVSGDAVNLDSTGATFDTQHVGSGKTVTATGLSLSGTDAANYSLPGTSTTTTAHVTVKALTLAAVTDTKTYDGTTSSGATVTVTGLEGNDTAAVSQAFTNKNVLGANGSTLQVNSGYTVNDGNSGNNYSVSTSTATGTISKAALTVAMSNQTKVYDGTTAATLASGAITATGVTVNGVAETASVSQTAGTFNNKNVTSASSVTASLDSAHFTAASGVDLNNYNLPTTVTGTGTITKANLTLSGTRVYDGSTSFAGSNLTATGVNNETFTLSGSGDASNLASKNVQTNQALSSVTGLALGTSGNGGLSDNYNAISTTGSSVRVTAKSATVSATATTKTYSGLTQSQDAATSSDFIAGDNIVISGASSGKNAGTYTSDMAVSGTDAGNYSVAITNADLTINKANLTLSGTRVYDASTSFAGSNLTATGVNNESFALSGAGDSSNLASKNVQTNQALSSVTGLALGTSGNGGLSDNYNAISTTGSNVSVTAKSATVSATATTKTYSGLTQSQDAATSSDFIAGDNIVISGASSGKNAGTYTSNMAVSGTDAGNYSVSITNADLTINKANLTLSGTRVYDASTSFAGSNLTATGVNNETFALSGAGDASNLASKNVQTNQALSSVTGLILGAGANGGISDNYNAINTTGSSVSVTPKSATVSATATTKTYSGLTQSQDAATSSGFIGTDEITISGASSGKNAGTYTSALSVSGTDAGNYSVAITNADLTINKANLTLSGTRVYDASTSFAGSNLTATGVNNETFTLSGSGDASNLASKNVQTNQALSSVTGLALGTSGNGGLSDNYNAISTTGSNVRVTAKSATVSATATTETYSGLTQSQDAATSSDFIAGDNIVISGASSGKNAGTYTSDMAVSGTDAGNYSVAITNADLTINKANLTVAMSDQTKVYDGTRKATLASGAITATGVTVNGVAETATVSQTAGTYNTKDVATANLVTANLASADFTAAGATDLNNYNLPTSVTGTGSITAKSVTYAGLTVNNKTYDRSTSASLGGTATLGTVAAGSSLSTDAKVIATDSVSLSGTAAGTYASKDVTATNNTVTFSGLSLSGGDAGNYTLVQQASVNGTGTITAKTLTATVQANDKTYDGTANATLKTVNGMSSADVISGDSVTFSNSSASFADRHVAKDGNGNVVGKTVTVSGLAIAGDDASNYSLASTSATTSAKITPKALTLAAVTDSKTYDSNTSSSGVVTALALESGDTVTATQSFGSKDVMGSNASTLQVNSGYTINDSNDGNNYSVSTSSATGTISQKALTVTANDDARFVTQADSNNFSGVSYSGFAGLEDASVLGGTLSISRTNAANNVSAGTYAGTLVASGLTSGNYSISYTNGDYRIIPANQLLIKTSNVSTVYGTAPTYNTTAQYLDGANVIHTLSQSLNGSTLTFSDGVGGSVSTVLQPYTVSNGVPVAAVVSTSGNTVVGTYSILDTNPLITGSNFVGSPVYSGTLTVTPKALTASMSASNKVYDGGVTAAVTGSSAHIVAGDKVNFANTSSTFNNKNAGLGKTVSVTGISISGDDAANYALQNTTASTTADVTPKVITLTAGSLSKTYDGDLTYTTQMADLSTLSNQLISGDSVSAATISYADKNAASGTKVVTLDAVTLSDGNSGGNYTVTLAGNSTSTITQKSATVSATATTKTYNGLTQSQVAATSSGFIGTDAITISGASSGKNAGTYTSNLAVSGNDAGNYSVSISNADLTIGKADLTVAMSNQTKTYDGTTAATLASGAITATGVTVNGVAETASVSQTAGTYNNKNVTSASSVTASLDSAHFTAASGVDLNNYNLPAAVTGVGSITKANLTLSGTRVYDASTSFAGSNLTATGVNNETFTLSGSGDASNLASKNVQTNQALSSVTGLALGTSGNGGLSDNYNAISTTGSNVRVTAKSATVSATATTKTYSGLTQSQDAATSSDFIAGDNIVISGASSGKNAGTYTSDMAVSGTDAGNYSVAITNADLTINKANLTLSGTRVYDASTSFAGSNLTATGVNNESFALSGAGDSSNLASKNVQTNQALSSVTGLALGTSGNGGLSDNYNAISTTGSNVSVTAKALTLAAVTDTKTYDGTTSSSAAVTVTGLQGNDTASVSQAFASKNVMGTGGSTLQVNSGYTINDGNSGNNYSVSTSTASGTINKADLTVALSNQTKTYDGTTTATLASGAITATGVTVNGVAETASVSQTAGTYNTKDVATANTVTASLASADFTAASGTDLNNYNLPTTVTATGTITKANLAVAMSNQTKTYDGTTAATLASGAITATGVTVNGVAESASVSQTAGTYNTKNVATANAVTASLASADFTAASGTDLNNYNLPTTVTGTGAITKANLTLSGTRVYDASTSFAGSNLTATGVNNETFALSGAGDASNLASKNVQTNQALSSVTGLALGSSSNGGLSDNYNAISTTGSSVNVTAKALSLAAVTDTKIYDGSISSSGTVTIVGLEGSDTATATQAFANKNVLGTQGSTLQVNSGYAINDGNSGNNYKVSTATAVGTINKANLALAGTRVYDATTSFAGQNLTATGVNGETFTLTGAGDASNLASKNVQTNQALSSVTGLALGTSGNGGLSGNYNDISTSGSSVTVTAKTATVNGTATSTTYDGLTQAQTAASSSGFITGDNITITGESSGKNAGTYTSNMVVSGTDAGNYAVAVTNADLTINKANLSLSGSRTYDAGQTFAGQYLTSTGVNGETFTLTGAGDASNLASKNVQTNQALSSVTGLALGTSGNGGLSDNYNDISTSGSSVTVTAKAATVNGTATSTTYNGLTQAQTAASSSGFITGDNITITGESSGKNAGTYTSNMVVSGTDAGNYAVTVTNADLTINKANLAVAMSNQTKTYDGTTSATLASGAITATGVTVNGVAETAAVTQTAGIYNSKNVVGSTSVTASLASNDFTAASGVDLGNYNLPTTVTSTGSITAKSVSYSGLAVSNKTYDQTTSASLSGTAALGTVAAGSSVSTDGKVISTDTVSLSGIAVGTYASKNVAATNNTVTFSGLSLSGADASNYTLVQQTSINGTGTIVAKTLTPTVTANDKTYDGSSTATVSTMGSTDVYSGDTVTFSNTGASFVDRHVAKDGSGNVMGKTVTVSGLAIDGTDASNYALASTSATTTAKITPKALTLAAGNDSKTYDGTTTSNVAVTAEALESMDTITASQSFASKNVMDSNGSILQVNSGYTIHDGNSGNNYSVSTRTATGTISKAALTVTTNADAKFVTQADAAGYNGVSYSGWVNGETSAVLGGTLSISRTNASTNVGAGTYAGTLVASGLTSGNYTISYATGDYTIVPANQLLIRTNNVSTVYGTAPTYSTTAQYLDGSNVIHILSQSGTGNSFDFSDGAGGSVSTVLKPYTVASGLATAASVSSSGNTAAGTYSILDTNPSITGSNFVGSPVYVGTLTVTPKALTATMAASNKVYDGTVTASVTGSSADVLTGDKISFATTSATFDSKNVGNSKAVAVSGISIGDVDAGNYTLQNSSASATANVTPKAITLTAGNVSKTYDGGVTYSTQTADLTTLTNQLVGGDSVTAATISYANKNAANGTKVVTLDAVTLDDGNSGGNYTVTLAGNSTSTITPKAITLTAGSVSKTYDGGTAYTTQAADLTTLTNQLISGDSVSAATISYTDKNAASGTKAVTLDAVTLSDGNSGGNYTVTLAGNSTSTITRKNLTAAYTASNKVYDGNTAATVVGASSDIVTNDVVTFANTSATFDTKNVGTGKTVDISGISIGGTDGGNYALQNTTASTTANVTKKDASITGATTNVIYNATTQTQNAAVLDGFIASDVTGGTVAATGLATGRNAGSYTSNLSATGTDAGNYNVSVTNADLVVGKKDASITGTTTNVTYNATTQTQNAAALSGFIASDVTGGTVAATGLATGRNAGNYTSNLSATGTDAGNYNVSVTNADLVVGKKDASITGTTTNVTYNATTQTQNAAVLDGFIASDVTAGTVAVTGLATGRNAGSYTSNLSATGTDAGNYNVTVTNANLVVDKKSLVLAAGNDSKTYDGTTNSSGTVSAAALQGADTFTASQSFVSKDAMGTNGSTLQVNSGYTIHDGNSGNNYTVSTSTATGTISQAALTVTANADAKFVTQTDATGYNGVSYSGLVNGETGAVLGGTLSISRTNASTHVGAGTYAGTLVASGLTSGNYTISYANGDYTIVPANQLLIRTNNVLTVYGTAPTYNTTAQYLDGSNVIHTLSQSGTGNSFDFSDGVGGSVATVLKPYSGAAVATQSSTGHTVVGSYAIKDANVVVDGNNFVGTPVYVGNLTVTPKEVSTSASGLSKVYDGTTAMGNATLSLAGQLAGDQLGVSGTGAFNQKNVGTNLSYAFKNVALTGSDRGNYYLSGGNNLTGTNGVITPAPLTIVGTQASDKHYDGTTQASVTPGTVSGLVGSETLSIAKVEGQFDTPTPGHGKAVKVVYTFGNGSNGGLASNYTWSPVFTTAQIFSPAKDQRYKPELPAVADTFSRVSYLGFNAKTGAAVAGTSRTPWQANHSACTASRIEECICEQLEDPSVEICVAPTRAQAESKN